MSAEPLQHLVEGRADRSRWRLFGSLRYRASQHPHKMRNIDRRVAGPIRESADFLCEARTVRFNSTNWTLVLPLVLT